MNVSGAPPEPKQTNTTLEEKVSAEQKQSLSVEDATKGPETTISSRNTSKESLVTGNLSKQVIEQCEKAIKEVMSAAKFSESLDPKMLFQVAERLLAFRMWLTAYILSSEQEYRLEVAKWRENGESVAGAEAQARIGNGYRAYKYVKRVDDISDEQVKLVKRFKEALEDEFNQS